MSLNENQITAQNFKEFYGQIRPYLNGAAHSGFTPVGVVISVMGKTAPLNYLVCDGTVYNIADYPELAAYFARQFDVCNYFGGNGTTTFAVPDLRGEFLRGTGTNSHTNQGSGADVGTHQDGTEIPQIVGGSGKVYISDTNSQNGIKKPDSMISNTSYVGGASGTSGSASYAFNTIRPTNTSVLYCIAYKNIFVDEGCNYSTDEKVVGTWTDGKPLYQKVIRKEVTFVGTGEVFLDPIPDAESWFIVDKGVYQYSNYQDIEFPVSAVNDIGGNYDFLIMNYNFRTGRMWVKRGNKAAKYLQIIVRYTKSTD